MGESGKGSGVGKSGNEYFFYVWERGKGAGKSGKELNEVGELM